MRRRLVVGVYAYSILLAGLTVVATILVRQQLFGSRAHAVHRDLMQVAAVAFTDVPAGQHQERVDLLATGLHSRVSLFDDHGALVAVHGAPFVALAPAELARLGHDALERPGPSLAIRVATPSGPRVLVVEPPSTRLPTELTVAVFGAMLVIMVVASLWFARQLSRPLAQLARAADAIGSGDLTARVRPRRRDELGDVGRAFDEMATRLQQLHAGQRELLANVSHELRTPLARIRVALELAAEDPTAAAELLGDVGDDLAELERLLDDTLTTARLDALPTTGTPPLRLTEVIADDLLEQIALRFARAHPRRTLARTIDAALAELPVACDPVLLGRAVANLLDNAARYSDAAHPIELRARVAPSELVIDVIDRGSGLTADELAHVFEPFWRSDQSRSRNTGGVGLGLSLARRIAVAHGGTLTLASTPRSGTTATVRLPLTTS